MVASAALLLAPFPDSAQPAGRDRAMIVLNFGAAGVQVLNQATQGVCDEPWEAIFS